MSCGDGGPREEGRANGLFREYVMRHREGSEGPASVEDANEQRMFVRIGGSGFRFATALAVNE